MLLTLRMVAEVVVIVLTTKLKGKKKESWLNWKFSVQFFFAWFFFLQVNTYLVLIYLRDKLLMTEKGCGV